MTTSIGAEEILFERCESTNGVWCMEQTTLAWKKQDTTVSR